MKYRTLVAIAAVILVAMGASAYAQEKLIIQVGQNSPEWNRKLGVNATRGSCNLPPEGCMKQVAALLESQHTKRFFLNLYDEKDPRAMLARATYYSRASLSEPRLYEIGLDDFTDHFNGWCMTPGIRCDGLLADIIAAVKSQNHALTFGITLYEDQLPAILSNRHLNPTVRGEIDAVHLYLHRRTDGTQYANYVDQVKHSFPNATVIAGAYAYDRIDYVTCGNARCTFDQELDLYKRALRIQLDLLQQGNVGGIEFYPGYFGTEDKWSAWDDPKICAPGRKPECISNTRALHEATWQLLRQAGIGSP